jgi:hypothetical protein
VRGAFRAVLAGAAAEVRAALEWLSRALLLALAATGLAFLAFLALRASRRRAAAPLAFCSRLHTGNSSSDDGAETGAGAGACAPCPAHGACVGGALVRCAAGYEAVGLRYEHAAGAAHATATPSLGLGAGRCVPTWGTWAWAAAAAHAWLLLPLALVAWLAWRRRREQWRAAAAERWLHTCWALLSASAGDAPVPVDWLQHKVVDATRTH